MDQNRHHMYRHSKQISLTIWELGPEDLEVVVVSFELTLHGSNIVKILTYLALVQNYNPLRRKQNSKYILLNPPKIIATGEIYLYKY